MCSLFKALVMFESMFRFELLSSEEEGLLVAGDHTAEAADVRDVLGGAAEAREAGSA